MKSKGLLRKGTAFLLAAATLFTTMFSGVSTPETVEASTVTSTKPADGSSVYLYNDGHISYGSYGTHYFKTSESSSKQFSWDAYCADPAGGTPASGSYVVDYDIENYTISSLGIYPITEETAERIVYQLYGQPEYDRFKNIVQGIFGTTDWTGSAWDDDSYYVLSHLVASCLFGSVDAAFYGVSDSFVSYFEDAYDSMVKSVDYGSDRKVYSVIANLTYSLSTYRPSTMNSSFDVYVLKTQDVSSSYQLILGTYYDQEYNETPCYGYIEVTKTSAKDSSYSLKGAVYGVYGDSSCSTKVTEITIGSDGTGTSSALYLGTDSSASKTYYVKEISAPEGYVKSDTVKSVTVTKDNTSSVPAEVTMTEDIIEAKITVNKVDSETGTVTAQGDADLDGAVFTVYNNTGSKLIVNGTTYANGDKITTLTIKNGTATSISLPYGDYIVKETTAPEGYKLDSTEHKVSITSDGGDKTITVEEDVQEGRVTITKVDADTLKAEAQGDGDLSGAVFTIYNNSENPIYYNGKSIGTGEAVTTIVTESNGVATLSSNSLPYGTYYAKETTAPKGYNLDSTTVYNFTIRSNGQLATATASDEVKRGGFTITKVDADTQEAKAQGDGVLSGAKFTVYNVSDASVVVNGVSYATGTKSSNNGTVKIDGTTYYLGAAVLTTSATNSNGKATVDTSTLPYGTYVIMETTAPTGYLLSEDAYVFTIRSDGQSRAVTIDDEIIRGGVEIYKYDYETEDEQGDATFEGATFAIINASDNAVVVDGVSYDVGETVLTLTTDENGYATTDTDGDGVDYTLPYGTYTIKETTAPTGYLVDGVTERTFTIRENGVVVDMTDVSKSIRDNVIRGGVAIYKMDSDLVDLTGADAANGVAQGDATLAGATYAIVNKSEHAVLVNNVLYQPGEVVCTLTTDDDGYAATDSDTLPYGTYQVYETSETDYGYLLNEDDVTTFTIREDGVIVELDDGEIVDEVKRQAFQIVKISADTNATEVYGVEGAEFTIYNVSDSVVTLGDTVYQTGTETSNNGTSTVNGTTYYLGDAVETITTDSTGYACSSRLSYGTYVVRETKTPTDLNTVEDFVVVIREDSTEPQTWRYFNDSPFTAYIKAIKEDSKTGQTVLISGVSFKILNTDTNEYVVQKLGEDYIDTFYTKESGYTVTPLKLECGNYELVEITAPYGYTVKDEGIKFTVSTNTMYQVDQDDDAVITVECVNDEVTGTVTVYKHGEALTGTTTDADGNIDFVYEDEPLAGSTFVIIADEDIYTPDMQVDGNGVRTITTYNGVECYEGTVVATITSGSDGCATATGLPLGSYHIEEIGVTSGYTINTYVDSFTLTYKDQDTAVIYYTDSNYENERVTTELSLTKTGLKSGEVIEGATYGLYAAEDIVSYFGDVLVAKGTLIETRTTDENGEISWTADLPLYNYYVQETEAAVGTLYNDEVYYVDLSYQGASIAVVSDSVDAVNDEVELDVSKLDAETGYDLEGAVLQLLDENGEVVDEWTTDGIAHKIYRLAPGYYTIHEVSAPAGYVTFSDVTVKVLLIGEVQEVRIADEQTELHVSKVDATNSEELPGAILQIIDESGEVLYEWTSTDEEYVIKKIPVGTYTLHEDYTPLGYATAQDVEFTVLDTGDIQSVEMIDEIITVSITKADATTGEEISGAELTLYDAQGEIVDQWTSTDEAHIITGLYVGETYTLHEDLAPIGYATAQDVTFTIADTGEVQEVVMYDEIITVSISKKEATGGEELAGAILTLVDANGEIIETWTSTDEAHVITGLHVGETYTLHEDLAPLGYATASDVTFTIADTGEVQSVEMVDEIITVSISKKDATTGEELPGATLQVLDSEGNVVDEWTSTDEPHIITGLYVGETYTLHEDLAPLGYATASDVTFTIADTGEVQSVEMVDELTTVSITKADATTGEELPGAQLTLIDADGEVVETWVSTDEAHVITGLHVGETYTLHEDLAPLGYATASDVTFTVSDTAEVQKVTMYDEIITVSISKKDATTGEELPGAELTLYDSEGNVVDQWTSTDEAHVITGLTVGETYTLHEDCAPAGYNTASDVTFTISDTGEVQEVVMYDEVKTEVSSPKTNDRDMTGAFASIIAGLGLIIAGIYGNKKNAGLFA